MVVLPVEEYEQLVDSADSAAADKVRRDIAAGTDELVPASVVDKLIAGDNPVRVWRAHRGIPAKALAASAGISSAYLSEIESGRKQGSVSALKAIAAALSLDLDDLV